MAINWWKVVAKFPYKDQFARDVAENVFYFNSPTTNDVDTVVGALTALLVQFYTGTTGDGRTDALSAYLAFVIDRPKWSLSFYEVDPATGHTGPPQQVVVNPEPLANPTNVQPAPEEVALCSSYGGGHDVAGELSTLPVASRYGRIYLGPLNIDCLYATGDGYSIPKPSLITDLQLASATLVEAAAFSSMQWVIWSVKHLVGTLIEQGWVDNAWDTQRRRGTAPTARQRWGP